MAEKGRGVFQDRDGHYEDTTCSECGIDAGKHRCPEPILSVNQTRKKLAIDSFPEETDPLEAAIRKSRGAVYGDPQENHANIAAIWTALLRSRFGQNIPALDAQMVELMLAGFKVLRAARPVPSDPEARASYMDSFPDARNYLTFAEEAVK